MRHRQRRSAATQAGGGNDEGSKGGEGQCTTHGGGREGGRGMRRTACWRGRQATRRPRTRESGAWRGKLGGWSAAAAVACCGSRHLVLVPSNAMDGECELPWPWRMAVALNGKLPPSVVESAPRRQPVGPGGVLPHCRRRCVKVPPAHSHGQG